MSAAKALTRSLLTCALFLFLASAVLAQDGTTTAGALEGIDLVLEINAGQEKPFYLPILPGNQRFAVVPVKGSAVSAVKVFPHLVEGRIEVHLAAVFGDVGNLASCAQLDHLELEAAGSYTLHPAQKGAVTIFDLAGLAVEPIELRVIHPRIETPEGTYFLAASSGECCSCGGLLCCPNPDKCFGCGSCGLCCNTCGFECNSTCVGVDYLTDDLGLSEATCDAYCSYIGKTCYDTCTTNRGYTNWGVEAWVTESQCNSYSTSGGQVHCDTNLANYSAHDRRKYRCCCG